MDSDIFKSYIGLIKTNGPDGLQVFIRDITDDLSDFVNFMENNHAYDKHVKVVLFLKTEHGWIFFSNLSNTQHLSDSIINMYCTSNISFTQNTLPPRLHDILKHYFPQKQLLNIYHVADFSIYDQDGAVFSLFQFYKTIISDCFIINNLLSKSETVGSIIDHIRQCVDSDNLLRFHKSVFRDVSERPHPFVTLQILTSEELSLAETAEKLRRYNNLLKLQNESDEQEGDR